MVLMGEEARRSRRYDDQKHLEPICYLAMGIKRLKCIHGSQGMLRFHNMSIVLNGVGLGAMRKFYYSVSAIAD